MKISVREKQTNKNKKINKKTIKKQTEKDRTFSIIVGRCWLPEEIVYLSFEDETGLLPIICSRNAVINATRIAYGTKFLS